MTLLRQLVLLITTLCLLLFSGSLAINVKNTRDYLANQLQTISQDTATTLGLSLSPQLAANDLVVVERMLDAVSDSGYYQSIVLLDAEGSVVIERQQTKVLSGIPEWFVNLIPLSVPVGEAQIMTGWVQAGIIRISANPGYAYATLWQNSLDALVWFLAASAIALVLGVASLRLILKPLRDVEAQAQAICQREFPIQPKLPWTLELRSVVDAMNRMASKIKEIFDEQADALQRLRDEAWKDNPTGLANRRYFDMQLTHLMPSAESSALAALILIELHDFKNYNERRGFAAGDHRLNEIARLINRACGGEKGVDGLDGFDAFDGFAARLTGGSFAVVAVNSSADEINDLVEKLHLAIVAIGDKDLLESGNVAHIGYTHYQGQTKSELLAESDMALRIAQNQGPNSVHKSATRSAGGSRALSASDWSRTLQTAINGRHLAIFRQATFATDSTDVSATSTEKPAARILHFEALLRIYTESGELVPANVLIPMARRFHLGQQFDQMVVAEVLERLAATPELTEPVAINLFPQSIVDSAFVAGLINLLKMYRDQTSMLLFEIHEHGAAEHYAALQSLIPQLHALGAKIGLDQFGRTFGSFDYLSALKLDYVRIDGSFIRGIDQNTENQFFVESIVKVAHALDMAVYAESVETEAEANTLRGLCVSGLKGFGLQHPVEWKRPENV